MNDKINNDPNTMSYENKEFNNNTKQLNLLTNEITYLYDIIQTQNEKIIDLEISIEKLKHNTETIKTNLKRTDSLRIKNLRSIKKLQKKYNIFLSYYLESKKLLLLLFRNFIFNIPFIRPIHLIFF